MTQESTFVHAVHVKTEAHARLQIRATFAVVSRVLEVWIAVTTLDGNVQDLLVSTVGSVFRTRAV